MEEIAKRAGVGKQTIYRWWPSKAAVLLDALNEQRGEAIAFPDTGDIVADLRTQMTAVVQLFLARDILPYRGLIAAAQDEPAVAEAILERTLRPAIKAARDRLVRAQQQGQVRADADPDAVIELLYAPLYYRLLLRTRPVSPQQVTTILDLAFAGLRPHLPPEQASSASRSPVANGKRS